MESFAEQLRSRRRARRISQLDLSLEAGVSARHLAFLETERSRPSREMVLRLAEALQTPLAERNRMLTAAGFAAEYPLRDLADPALAPVREAMSRLLRQQDPYPAVVMDRSWRILEANHTGETLFKPVLAREDRSLIGSLVEDRMWREAIENWATVAPEMLARLKLERSLGAADAALDAWIARFEAMVRESCGEPEEQRAGAPSDALFVSPILRVGGARLSMFSTIAHFGAPREISIAELQIELFFPLDEETEAFFRSVSG